MSVLCVVNVDLVWDNDIGPALNGSEWNMINLCRCISFPCLPPVGTALYLECENFNYLVVEEICFFEKSERVGETPVFHLNCEAHEMGVWEGGPGSGRALIEVVEGYMKD